MGTEIDPGSRGSSLRAGRVVVRRTVIVLVVVAAVCVLVFALGVGGLRLDSARAALFAGGFVVAGLSSLGALLSVRLRGPGVLRFRIVNNLPVGSKKITSVTVTTEHEGVGSSVTVPVNVDPDGEHENEAGPVDKVTASATLEDSTGATGSVSAEVGGFNAQKGVEYVSLDVAGSETGEIMGIHVDYFEGAELITIPPWSRGAASSKRVG